jgi:hypothetical protein
MNNIITEAIRLTHSEAVCIREDRICFDKNSQQISIDDEIVDAKIVELEAEWTANEYARNRSEAYDSVGNQLDMIYKDNLNGTTTHKASVEAVKAKYPKPE